MNNGITQEDSSIKRTIIYAGVKLIWLTRCQMTEE